MLRLSPRSYLSAGRARLTRQSAREVAGQFGGVVPVRLPVLHRPQQSSGSKARTAAPKSISRFAIDTRKFPSGNSSMQHSSLLEINHSARQRGWNHNQCSGSCRRPYQHADSIHECKEPSPKGKDQAPQCRTVILTARLPGQGWFEQLLDPQTRTTKTARARASLEAA